jgi:amino acid transporter
VPAIANGMPRVLTLLLVVGAVVAVNLIGVRQATRTVNAFTLVKLAPLLLLALIGLPQVDSEVFASQAVQAPDWAGAVLLMVFAFGGFETAMLPAGEMKDPRRDTAIGLLAAIALIACIYLVLQVTVVGVLPNAADSEAPISATAEVLLGHPGLLIATVAAVISTLGWTQGAVLQVPRLLYAMAERGDLPNSFMRLHPRWRTPHVSIVAFAAISLAFAIAGSFAANATLAALTRLLYYLCTCMAFLVFRRRRAPEAAFRVPFGRTVAGAAMGFCVWLLATRSFEQAWLLGALVLVGVGLYSLTGGSLRSQG